MRRFLVVLACGLMLAGGWRLGTSASAVGDDQPTADGSTITLTKCRVKLVDEVLLASDRPGILAFVEPREGDRVAAKQQIAGLNDKVAQAQHRIAQKRSESDIERRYALKAFEVAQVEYQKSLEANERFRDRRGGRLNDNELPVPPSELRRLKLSADKHELQIEQADHEYEIHLLEAEQTAAELETYKVIAPFDGVVTRVHKKEGEAVRQGDPILEVVSTDRLRVEGRIDIKDLWRIKPGQPVRVSIEFDDIDLKVEREVFEGRLVFIDESVEPVTKKVIVWAEVANREAILKAGLPARMTIFTEGEPATTAAKK